MASTSRAPSDPTGLRDHGYELGDYLGGGAHGSVYKARYIGTEARGDLEPGTAVALKFIPSAAVNPKEVLFQARIRHVSIVRLFDVFALKDTRGHCTLCVVMEVADHTKTQLRGPSLWTCVEHTIRANMECRVYNPGAGLDEFQSPLVGGEPMIRWIFMQIVSPLEYMHTHPLYLSNRDVKGDNVLITNMRRHVDGAFRPDVKIADFGFAASGRRSSRLGTPDYVAPEIFSLTAGAKYEGSKADVWSAGVMLYTLAAGLLPFREHPNDSAVMVMRRSASVDYLRTKVLAPERLSRCSEPLRELLGIMLTVEPERRWTMTQVMHHDWCKRLDHDLICTRPGDGLEGALPCWRWCVNTNVQLRRETERAYATAEARGFRAADFVPYGWNLPHLRYSDVVRMMQGVLDNQVLPRPRYLTREEWDEVVRSAGGPWDRDARGAAQAAPEGADGGGEAGPAAAAEGAAEAGPSDSEPSALTGLAAAAPDGGGGMAWEDDAEPSTSAG